MSFPHLRFQLKASIASAKAPINQRETEYQWYGPWNLVLSSIFSQNKDVVVCPQYSLTRIEYSNDDVRRYRSQIPDFALVFNHTEGTESDLFVLENRVVLVVEVKAISSRWSKERIDEEFRDHAGQLKGQAKYIFARSMQREVHGLLCIGDHWKCYAFERNTLSPLSDNQDPGYIPDEDSIISHFREMSQGVLSADNFSFEGLSREIESQGRDF